MALESAEESNFNSFNCHSVMRNVCDFPVEAKLDCMKSCLLLFLLTYFISSYLLTTVFKHVVYYIIVTFLFLQGLIFIITLLRFINKAYIPVYNKYKYILL